MKKLFTLLVIVLSTITAEAQFPSTDSLRNYNIVWVTNNASRAFTNYRLHTLLAGMIDWIDSARAGEGGTIGIDSLAALNDSTIRYRKNGTFRTFTIKGVYDYRRKVDSAYNLNDSTIRFIINGSNHDVTIRGAPLVLDTRIPFGDATNRMTDDPDLTYSSSTNRFNTGTGNFADSVLVEDLRTVALTDNAPIVVWDGATKALTQISHNSFIKNQFASKQSASSWYDSTKYHSGLIISSRGGGQPSLFSPNLLWYLATSNQHVFASLGTGANDYPILQLTHFNQNQAHTRSGAVMAYNFNTVGTSNKQLLITTSGFHNAAGGDILISPGQVWNGTNFTGGRKVTDFNIILDPNANGEVQMTRIANFQYGWKTSDSVSSSTTITITVAKAVWTFTGSSTATWTLPALSGNEDVTFFIKNKGSADIVLTAGTNEIYSSSATTTFNIIAGQGYIVRNDGTHWTILNN